MTATARRTAAEALTPADLVERMLELTAGLTDIVRRETGFLRDRARSEVAALQPEKIRIANDYAMDAEAIRRRKDLIDRAPAERVSKLKSAMIELDRALAETARRSTPPARYPKA